MSSDRDRALSELKKRVGFPFSESELSPTLRRQVGELELSVQRLDSKRRDIQRAQVQMKNHRDEAWISLIVGIVGLLFLIASVIALAIVLPILFVAYYFYDRSREDALMINTGQNGLAQIWAETNPKLDAISKDIFNELSQSHAGRSTQTTVQREIERETVKIRCPYCRTINPDSRSTCSHCGARL